MSFSIVYVGGGMLDKVRSVSRLEGGRLDGMPTLTAPFVKGRQLEVPGQVTTVADTFSLPFDTELMSIAIGSSVYQSRDFWELKVGADTIIETIYTKALPEGITFMVAYPIPADTPIKLEFHNVGGSAKKVWYNLQLLKGAGN